MTTMVPEDAPKPRVCNVKKWDKFPGYGFNLHAEKGKAGQYIGKVDDNSPAAAAGMKEGDRIVEVNGVNISNENHQQVVTRIKHDPNCASLLLVDTETDNYYKERKIVIRGDMPNVKNITCPDTSDGTPTEVEGTTPSASQEEEEESRATETLPESPAPSTPSTVESAPRPRLCHVKTWPNFQGYGFNLHAEKGKPGQFIGKVDDGSPAEAAGLKEGDRILEVNGESVAQDTHQQVVQKIKGRQGETELLVVDPQTDTYYKDRGQVVTGSMDEVQRLTCPDSKPTANGSAEVEAEVNHQDAQTPESLPVVAAAASTDQEEVPGEVVSGTDTTVVSTAGEEGDDAAATPEAAEDVADVSDTSPVYAVPHRDRELDEQQVNGEAEVAAVLSEVDQAVENEEQQADDYDATYEQVVIPDTSEPEEPSKSVPEATPASVATAAAVQETAAEQAAEEVKEEEPATPTSPGPVTIAGIEFAGSIEEAKQRASRKKKKDPRMQQQSLSMKDKYDMFQRL